MKDIQSIILKNYKDLSNRKTLDKYTHHFKKNNHACGDNIEFYLKIKDEIIKEISFIGEGCSLSISATNILIEILKYKKLTEARNIIKNLENFFLNKENLNENVDSFKIFNDYKDFPIRLKCILLPIKALNFL